MGWFKKVLRAMRHPIVGRLRDSLSEAGELIRVGQEAAEDGTLTLQEAIRIFKELADVIDAVKGE